MWPAGTRLQSSRRQEEFPTLACPVLPALCAGCQARGSRRPSRLLPLGASGKAEVETWLHPSACWPKELCWHKGGSVLEGNRSQLLPAQEGRGRGDVFLSRALPTSWGDASAFQPQCKQCLAAGAAPWGFQGQWGSV